MATLEEDYNSDDDEIEVEEEANLFQWLLQDHSTRCSLSLNFCTEEEEESDRLSLAIEATAMINGVFYMENDIDKLTEAIERNTQTSLVEILLDGDWSTLNLSSSANSSLIGLVSVLSEKSSLEGLIVEGGSGSITILNYILLQAQKLTTIELYDLTLYGTETAFEKLARNIASHPNLNRVSSFYLKIMARNSSQQMDRLLQAILQAPALESLGIWYLPNSIQGGFSTTTLVKACSSPTLTTLQLNGVVSDANDQDDALYQMAKALAENQILRALQLGIPLNPANAPALTHLLRENKGLDSVRFDLAQSPREIRRNQSCMIDLANALQHNQTLTRFKIVGDMHAVQLDEEVVRAFESMLESNYSLQVLLLLDYHDCDQRAKIDFYLRLNQMDRQKILGLEMHHAGPWLDHVAKQDLDAAMYYLSRNPSVFSTLCS